MLHYILISFTLVFLSIFAFIKLKYPFWNNQPVFHRYDYWRFFYSIPFVLQKYRPHKTKYCDFENIKTMDYLEIGQKEKATIVDVLQCYYIPSESVIHTFKDADLDAILTGQLETSYISIYIENEYKAISNTKIGENAEIQTIPKTIGTICSHSLTFYYKEPTQKSVGYVDMPIYFIDYLCVNRKKDTKTLSRKLLQTHEYNQRLRNPKVLVSLLKKEIELFDGIIPLVEYQTVTFELRNIHFPPLPPHFEVLEINAENLDILLDFLFVQKQNPVFEIIIYPDIGSITAEIKQRILHIYCLRNGSEIYGMYFLKDAKMQYENDKEINTLQLVGSIANSDSTELFYLGYLHGLRQIIKRNITFKYIMMEQIGHNCALFTYWREKHTPINNSDTAYYLYNMVYPTSPLSKERCFILT